MAAVKFNVQIDEQEFNECAADFESMDDDEISYELVFNLRLAEKALHTLGLESFSMINQYGAGCIFTSPQVKGTLH